MKIILFILITLLANAADDFSMEDNETCYNVQLMSKHNSQKNMSELMDTTYPDNCRIIRVDDLLAVRCGCYENKLEIESYFQLLQADYKDAYLRKTHKSLFKKAPKTRKKVLGTQNNSNKPLKNNNKNKLATCYTVQLISKNYRKERIKELLNSDLPELCKVMHINNMITVRCGCYESDNEANSYLLQLEDTYTNAYVTRTYKYRFDDTISSNITMSKPTPTKKIIEEKAVSIKEVEKPLAVKPIVQSAQKVKAQPVVKQELTTIQYPLKKAVKVETATYKKANAYFKRGEYERAIYTVKSSNHQDADSYLIWAKSAEALGRKDEATDVYQKIISVVSNEMNSN